MFIFGVILSWLLAKIKYGAPQSDILDSLFISF